MNKITLMRACYFVPMIFICIVVVKYALLISSLMGGMSLLFWAFVFFLCVGLCIAWGEALSWFFFWHGTLEMVGRCINVAEEILNKESQQQIKNIEGRVDVNEDDINDRRKSDGRIEPKL